LQHFLAIQAIAIDYRLMFYIGDNVSSQTLTGLFRLLIPRKQCGKAAAKQRKASKNKLIAS